MIDSFSLFYTLTRHEIRKQFKYRLLFLMKTKTKQTPYNSCPGSDENILENILC